MLLSLPKSSLNLFENSHFINFDIILLKSFRPIGCDNNISDRFYEVFNGIVETMDHVNLNSFSDEDAGEIIFLLRFSVITKEKIECNNYADKLTSFKNMLSMYKICYHDICDKLRDFFADDPDLTLSIYFVYKIISDKIPSFFTSLDAIFTGFTWEHRCYIYWALWNDSNYGFESQYEQKVSEAMLQSLGRMINVFEKSSKPCADGETI